MMRIKKKNLNRFLIFIFFVSVQYYSFSCEAIAANSSLEEIFVNDLKIGETVSEKKTKIPQAILDVIEKNAKCVEENSVQYDGSGSGEDCIQDVSVITMPNKDWLCFVGIKDGFLTYDKTSFMFVYSPDTKKVSPNVQFVSFNHYADEKAFGLLKRPYVSFENIKNDETFWVKLKQCGHNGNVYNSVVSNYYKIGSDLSVSRVLSIEGKVFDPLIEAEYIQRELKIISDSQLVVDVELVQEKNMKNIVRAIGRVFLGLGNDGKFHEDKKEVLDKKYEEILFNASGKDDGDFLLTSYGYFDYPKCD